MRKKAFITMMKAFFVFVYKSAVFYNFGQS